MKARAHTALSLVLLVVGVGAVVAFYVLPYVSHVQIPPGDDTPFYVGAIRDAGRIGLIDPEIASRPAYPLLGALLSSVSGASPWLVTAGLPVAIVAALGLAGAALAGRWGLRGPWVSGFAFLASIAGVAARLVAGKGENLMFLAFLAALLAVMAWTEGTRRWIGVGVIAFAAGLTEWPLMLVFLGIVVGGVLVELLRRDRPAASQLARLGVSTLAGFLVALGVVLLDSHASLGIRHLPGSARYGPRLTGELGLIQAPLTAVLAAIGWWVGRRFRNREIEPLRHLLTLWLVITGLVTVAGLVGAAFPSYRMLTFALPLLLASAASAFLPAGWRWPSRARRARAVRLAVGVLIAVAATVPGFAMWYLKFPPLISVQGIQQFQAAAHYAEALPGHGPVVLVVRLKAIHYLFYQRIARNSLPAGSPERLLVLIGDIDDALAGRPSKAFTPDGDKIIRQLFPPIARALRDGAPILTGRDVNPRGFAFARDLGDPTIGDGDVAVVRGPIPASTARVESLPLPIDPLTTALVAGFALAAMFVGGIGWCMVLAPRAPPVTTVALAPVIGAVPLSIVVFAGEWVGVRPTGGIAVAELVGVVVASVVAALFGFRNRRRSPPEVHAGTGAEPTSEPEPTSESEPVAALEPTSEPELPAGPEPTSESEQVAELEDARESESRVALEATPDPEPTAAPVLTSETERTMDHPATPEPETTPEPAGLTAESDSTPQPATHSVESGPPPAPLP